MPFVTVQAALDKIFVDASVYEGGELPGSTGVFGMTQPDWKRFAALLDFDHDGSVRIDECVIAYYCLRISSSVSASGLLQSSHRIQLAASSVAVSGVTRVASCCAVLRCGCDRVHIIVAGGYRRAGRQRN